MRRTKLQVSTALLSACVAIVLLFTSAGPAVAVDAAYERVLSSGDRSAKDHERDLRDKPADVLSFAGFKAGMRIADLFGGGGYYSEILAGIVGPKGHVMLVNNPPYANYAAEDLAVRFKDGRLPAVERVVVPSEDLRLGQATLDGALMVMSYHDLYYEDKDHFPHIDAGQFLEQVHAALKPHARLLIVDHSALAGSGNAPAQTLHRIEEAFAIKDLESHGFRLVRKYEGLRNAADDRSKVVFDPAIRGKTDRFVHIYEKR